MIQVRLASQADLESLASLFNLYRIFYGKISDESGAKKFIKERMEKNESVIFLVLSEGAPVGFTQLYPLFSSTRMKRLWLLNDLFVLPEQRGNGFSKALIEASKNHCAQTNACGLILETAVDNHIGNALYPKTGFKLDTEFNRYYWDI